MSGPTAAPVAIAKEHKTGSRELGQLTEYELRHDGSESAEANASSTASGVSPPPSACAALRVCETHLCRT